MLISPISFFSEDTSFTLSENAFISEWIINTIHSENFKIESLNIIFCSDPFILSINQEYLKHDYFTDIITFDNSDSPLIIEGDIFISIDRVLDNSQTFSVNFSNELYRVIIHGVLHLLGYSDKTENLQLQMREKENFYLSLLKF